MSEQKSQRWAWMASLGFGVYFLLIANGFNQWVNIPFDVTLEMLVIHTVAFTLIAITLFNDGFAEYLQPVAGVFFYLGFVPVLDYLAIFYDTEALISEPWWATTRFHVAAGLMILIIGYAVVIYRRRR
ncbi:TPA: hypothetical protein ACN30S_004719 [Vibrio campbellii]|jgi:hypothetical protein|uniref:hypothetical protein n=1 Tax=Vibrio jasicida TaxID=766224 RepID=UPI000CE3EE0A|nr:hypothetical protein [Vibrio jasicida]NWK16229.1 hypothetical protein [Vibrio parahaemolyticus]